MLGSAGYPAEGLNHLSAFEGYGYTESHQSFGMPRIHEWVLLRQNYWGNELVHLRATLQGDLEHNNKAMQTEHYHAR